MLRPVTGRLLTFLAMIHLSLGGCTSLSCHHSSKPSFIEKLGLTGWLEADFYWLFVSSIIFVMPLIAIFIYDLLYLADWVSNSYREKYLTLGAKVRWNIVISSILYSISCALKCVVLTATQSTKHPNPVKASFSEVDGQALAVFFRQMSFLMNFLLISSAICWRLADWFPVNGVGVDEENDSRDNGSEDSDDSRGARSWRKNVQGVWTVLRRRAGVSLSSILLAMFGIALFQVILAAKSFNPISASTYTSKEGWERILYEASSHIWLILSTMITSAFVALYAYSYRHVPTPSYLTGRNDKTARQAAAFLLLRAIYEIVHEILYYLGQTPRYSGKINMDILDVVHSGATFLIYFKVLLYTYLAFADEDE